nr:MAG TPA: MH2 domain [Caudoviricetes sp.]
MTAMERFDPEIHLPETDEDRIEIEKALWQGWELQVDENSGEVWIENREEKIADVLVR